MKLKRMPPKGPGGTPKPDRKPRELPLRKQPLPLLNPEVPEGVEAFADMLGAFRQMNETLERDIPLWRFTATCAQGSEVMTKLFKDVAVQMTYWTGVMRHRGDIATEKE